MKEILYLEVPIPETDQVKTWLQQTFEPAYGQKYPTPVGFRLQFPTPIAIAIPLGKNDTSASIPQSHGSEHRRVSELSVFVWSVQRTTYLKVFRWTEQPVPGERQLLLQLTTELRAAFPPQYPEPPAIDLSQQSIFEGLAAAYPLTVRHFQSIPDGEYNLTRVYWWERRWRESVRNPQQPQQVVFDVQAKGKGEAFQDTDSGTDSGTDSDPAYDLIYVGGALGVLHAAVMARLGAVRRKELAKYAVPLVSPMFAPPFWK